MGKTSACLYDDRNGLVEQEEVLGGMSLSRQRWIRSGAQVGGLALRMEHVSLCGRNFLSTGQKQNMCLQMLTGGVMG